MLTYALLSTLVNAPQEGYPKPLPAFTLQASDGLTYNQESLRKRPTLVVFFSSGCPHNPKSAPDFAKFRTATKSSIGIVGMTNLKPDEAKTYAKELGLNFPLLADPTGDVVKQFGARHSLDMAVIDAEKNQIGAFFKGYSQSILKQAVTDLTQYGAKNLAPDLSAYPEGRRSGCSF